MWRKYRLTIEKLSYNTEEEQAEIAKNSGKTELDFQLQQKIQAVGKDGNIADAFGIKEILFDLDK